MKEICRISRLAFLFLCILTACETIKPVSAIELTDSNEIVVPVDDIENFVYTGLTNTNETIVFNHQANLGFLVIYGDISYGPFNFFPADAVINVDVPDLGLKFFVPNTINIEDYIEKYTQWFDKDCSYRNISSTPLQFDQVRTWQHSIMAICKNAHDRIYLFSSKYGLLAFFDSDSGATPKTISHYVLIGSKFGLGADR